MRVCLFEDRGVLDLEPLTLTRPAFDLLCGLSPLADKQRRHFPPAEVGLLVRPELADLCRVLHPDMPVNDAAWLRAGPVVLVNGRWLPGPGAAADTSQPCVAVVGGEVAYAALEPDHLACCSAETIDECLAAWKGRLPQRSAGGRMFHYLWELVAHNGEQIIRDWETRDAAPSPPGVVPAVVGPAGRLRVDPTARIDPLVVADTTGGPVVIGPGAVVTAFTRLEGPCCVGPGTQLHGAKIRAGTTLGPDCRIGGEVEASVVQGHSNKYHDGFLGHAYVGEWVNLGAGTSNSDLRSDYGEVRVMVNGRLVPTGQAKVGCFLGDHTKTGLGALLNTGTNAGAFCNLLPGGLLPRYVPSFGSYWNGSLSDRADLWALLQTAAKVMGRRGRELTEAHRALYADLYERAAAERRRVVREMEVRALRRSA
jgi:UDP-N-acetylglucosamine diphosphorylase/glucosamine-1-phosphate N-acetyltransferase